MNLLLLLIFLGEPASPHISLWVDSVFIVAPKDTLKTLTSSVQKIENPTDFRADLRGLPSVLLRDLGGRISPSIRGTEDKETQVSLEGIVVNSPLWGFTPLNLFPEEFISAIKLRRAGISQGTDPSLLGGVDLFLKRGEPLLMTQIGSFGRKEFSLIVGDSSFSGGFHISQVLNDFRYRDRFGRKYRRENNDQRLRSAYFLKDNRFKILSFVSDLDMGLPRRGYGQEGSEREKYRQFLLSVGTGKFFLSSLLEDYLYIGPGKLEERYQSGRISAGFSLKGPIRMESALQWSGGKSVGKRYSWGFLPSLQLSSTLKGGRLDFLSQIQGDLNGGYLRILPSISFGISKRVSSRLLWYLLLRLSGRLPTFSELYWNNNGWVQGNPSLKGERGLGGDVGLRVRKYGLHELVFFYYVVKDAIFWMPQGEFWRPQNLSFVRFLGIETETTRGLGPFDLRGSMSLLLTSVKGGNVLPYRPNLSGRFEFSYKGMAVILTGAGKRPTHFSPRSEALPPYLLLDLSLSRSLNREHGKRVFELVIELRNLLDTSYEVISGYPMPGRNFTLSISMRP